MAKVKIQGNASGTGVITLTAPNTSTDRTVVLPDEDITLGGGVDGIVSTADATAMTITSDEDIGVGTASPSSRLHVYDGAGANIAIQSSAGSHWRIGDAVGASNGQLVIRDHTNSANRITILADGKVQTAQGILFGSDTAAANTLDDYEEGTWTAVPKFGGSTTGITGTFAGTYTKIGKQVSIFFGIGFTSLGSATGSFSISGIPFAPIHANRVIGGFGYIHRCTPSSIPHIATPLDGSAISFYLAGTSSNNASAMTNSSFTSSSSMQGGVTYETNS